MIWQPEQVEQLRALWADGVSASIIAERMGGGVSRCAVLGKVHRLNLPARIQGVGAVHQRKRPERVNRPLPERPLRVVHRAVAKKKPVEPPRARQATTLADTSPIAFGEARRCRCAWPLWPDRINYRQTDLSTLMVCGAATDGSSVYCEHHYERSVSRRSGAAA